MNGFFSVIKDLFVQITNMSFSDVLDIAIVSVILYYIYKYIRDRRAARLALGILLVLFIMVISGVFELYVLNFLVENIVQVGIIGLVILFQSELRSFLESTTDIIDNIFGSNHDPKETRDTYACIKVIVDSAYSLSADKTGALIVMEKGKNLGDVINTGTVINADPAVYLVKNIFFNKAPLHDGALVVRENRLYAAGCFLPLSQNGSIDKNLGTRHRAALGMSENSNALVVVVSEETGYVSYALGGELHYNVDARTLEKSLEAVLIGKTDNHSDNRRNPLASLFALIKKYTGKGGDRS